MGRVGFIQDKLEIKFLILYVASRLIEPVPFEAMQELTMCDDGIDFFDFSECLSNLVESQHLTLSDDGLYAITEKGLHNGAICESSLPYSVRLRADKNITIFNQKLKRRAQIKSDIQPRRILSHQSMPHPKMGVRCNALKKVLYNPKNVWYTKYRL